MNKKTGLIVGFTVLAVAGIIAGFLWIIRPKSVGINMDTPAAVEAKAIIKRMYLLEGNITCVPGTTVDVLAEVMVDASDYHLTAFDKEKIEVVYGKKAIAHAGLLTSKQAFYLSRDIPPRTPTNPPKGPTLRPTSKPVYHCSPDPEYKLDELLHYVSFEQWPDSRITVTYDLTSGRYEATLRTIDGKWKVTSIKLIKWYGSG